MAKKIITQPQKIIKRAKRQQRRRDSAEHKAQVQTKPLGEYIEGVGRRKSAIARVRIYQQKDSYFVVNDKLAQDYFADVPFAKKEYLKPFKLTNTQDKFAVTVKVSGSGRMAQLGAILHGLSRALVSFDPAFKTLLKEEKLLSRDPRMKETRKPGRGGKARRKRQSPKR
jgi:small subunit ribosomal protein S9